MRALVPLIWGVVLAVASAVTAVTTVLSFASGNDDFPFAGFLVISLLSIGLLVYGILMLVWLCQNGTPGPNRFGPDPKAAERDACRQDAYAAPEPDPYAAPPAGEAPGEDQRPPWEY